MIEHFDADGVRLGFEIGAEDVVDAGERVLGIDAVPQFRDERNVVLAGASEIENREVVAALKRVEKLIEPVAVTNLF